MAVFYCLNCSCFLVKSGGIRNLISWRRGQGAAMTCGGPCWGPGGGGGGGGCGAVDVVNVVFKLLNGPRSCLYSRLLVSTGLSDFCKGGVFSLLDPGDRDWDQGCKIAKSCDVEAVGVNGPGAVSIPNSLWALAISF